MDRCGRDADRIGRHQPRRERREVDAARRDHPRLGAPGRRDGHLRSGRHRAGDCLDHGAPRLRSVRPGGRAAGPRARGTRRRADACPTPCRVPWRRGGRRQSRHRAGGTFTVRLPAIARSATTDERASPEIPSTSRRILVIEDNGDTREVLRMPLTLEGHDVMTVADGLHGIESALAHQPDVVIHGCGLAEARRLRSDAVSGPHRCRSAPPDYGHRVWTAGRSPTSRGGRFRRPPRQARRSDCTSGGQGGHHEHPIVDPP